MIGLEKKGEGQIRITDLNPQRQCLFDLFRRNVTLDILLNIALCMSMCLYCVLSDYACIHVGI